MSQPIDTVIYCKPTLEGSKIHSEEHCVDYNTICVCNRLTEIEMNYCDNPMVVCCGSFVICPKCKPKKIDKSELEPIIDTCLKAEYQDFRNWEIQYIKSWH